MSGFTDARRPAAAGPGDAVPHLGEIEHGPLTAGGTGFGPLTQRA